MFHEIVGLSAKQKASADYRSFEGDGSPYLKVPGLKKIKAVRVGQVDVPLTIEQQIPTDATLKNFETQTVEMVKLVNTPEGEQVLLRNLQSNDGMWQKGVPVYVAGDWESAKGAAPKPEGAQ
jgi:hypothetical protein